MARTLAFQQGFDDSEIHHCDARMRLWERPGFRTGKPPRIVSAAGVE